MPEAPEAAAAARQPSEREHQPPTQRERETLADREPGTLADRVRAAAPGLGPLVATAEAVQRQRSAAETRSAESPSAEAAGTKERGAPRWTDVFTTQFTEFSNRPR